MRGRAVAAALAVVAALCACGGRAAPPAPDPRLADALLPEHRGELARHAGIPTYRIAARFDPVERTIAGHQALEFTNRGDAPLAEIVFRLYPNAAHYLEGAIAIDAVRCGDAAAAWSLADDDTTLVVTPPRPLAPGASTLIALDFATTVPTSTTQFGIFRAKGAAFNLFAWHPLLAARGPDGWLREPIVAFTEPTNTDLAHWLVEIDAPAPYRLIGGGRDERVVEGAVARHRFVLPLARNCALVGSPTLQAVEREVDGVVVRSWFGSSTKDQAGAALDAACSSLALFGRRFGPYPWNELDVVATPLGEGAGGMEATGIVMIDRSMYQPAMHRMFANMDAMAPGASRFSLLELVVAHEVAHQWWYGMVGSDSHRAPWLDEGLTSWCGYWWIEDAHGADTGAIGRDLQSLMPYRMATAGGDRPLDLAVVDMDEIAMGGIVYGKGALLYDALRAELGDERFFAFLRAYADRHRFARADETSWLATLREHGGDELARRVAERWIDGAGIGPADLPPASPIGSMFGGDAEGDEEAPELPVPGGVDGE